LEAQLLLFGSIKLTNAGKRLKSLFSNYDIFIAKYDFNGNLLWAQRTGGGNSDESKAITTDHVGNIYITGFSQSSTITFGNTTLTKVGEDYADIFVAKYNPSGKVLWAKSFGGSNYEEGECIIVDATGNIYLTGFFRKPSSQSVTICDIRQCVNYC